MLLIKKVVRFLSIGDRIVNLREKKGWAQRELARRVDLNYSVMNRIEKGTRPLTDVEIIKIADALGVSTDYLLKGINFQDQAEKLIDNPNTQIAARNGDMSKEKALDALAWLLEQEQGRKPGDKQKKK